MFCFQNLVKSRFPNAEKPPPTPKIRVTQFSCFIIFHNIAWCCNNLSLRNSNTHARTQTLTHLCICTNILQFLIEHTQQLLAFDRIQHKNINKAMAHIHLQSIPANKHSNIHTYPVYSVHHVNAYKLFTHTHVHLYTYS